MDIILKDKEVEKRKGKKKEEKKKTDVCIYNNVT